MTAGDLCSASAPIGFIEWVDELSRQLRLQLGDRFLGLIEGQSSLGRKPCSKVSGHQRGHRFVGGSLNPVPRFTFSVDEPPARISPSDSMRGMTTNQFLNHRHPTVPATSAPPPNADYSALHRDGDAPNRMHSASTQTTAKTARLAGQWISSLLIG